MATMEQLATGATRSSAAGKPDYRGFISPEAVRMFGAYMMQHQTQADGQVRSSDNWKKGMPLERYVESKVRHDFMFWELWEQWLEGERDELLRAQLQEEICGCYFNVQGWMREWMRSVVVRPKTLIVPEHLYRHGAV